MLRTKTVIDFSSVLAWVCAKCSGSEWWESITWILPYRRSLPFPVPELPPSRDGKGICLAPLDPSRSHSVPPPSPVTRNPEDNLRMKPASSSLPPPLLRDGHTLHSLLKSKPQAPPGLHRPIPQAPISDRVLLILSHKHSSNFRVPIPDSSSISTFPVLYRPLPSLLGPSLREEVKAPNQ